MSQTKAASSSNCSSNSSSHSKMASNQLPTPQPSTEILPSKRGSFGEPVFALPPAAIQAHTERDRSSIPGHSSDSPSIASPSPVNSDSSYHPLSPHPAKQSSSAGRRKSGAHADACAQPSQAGGAYTLPPPPTRSRKIIQMKPRDQTDDHVPSSPPIKAVAPKISSSAQSSESKGSGLAAGTAGTKRKQSGASTTAASRKIARKTAHSLIERRRRSKMNEEFGVLKDMIPACQGQEMHKLAILQASIEYMRYLEQCLADLKSARGSSTQTHKLPPISHVTHADNATPTADRFRSGSDEDDDMSDAVSPTSLRAPSAAASSAPSNRPSISPAILPSTHPSPEILGKLARYAYPGYHSAAPSELPSPAFEPQTRASGPAAHSFLPPPMASPGLTAAQSMGAADGIKDLEKDDHEATAALLMLNTDRRSWSGPRGGRGMSVKDLLSG